MNYVQATNNNHIHKTRYTMLPKGLCILVVELAKAFISSKSSINFFENSFRCIPNSMHF